MRGRGILRLYADEVLPGDELLVGPQGHPLPAAPTVFSVAGSAPIVAVLIDEGGFSEARWCADSRLTVLRPSAA